MVLISRVFCKMPVDADGWLRATQEFFQAYPAFSKSMPARSGSYSPSPAIQAIAKTFRITGWASFWAQLVLTVISCIVLVFAITLGRGANQNNPVIGSGVGVTFFGILVLGFNMYWAVTRYIPIGRKLAGNPNLRPRKSETIQAIRMGLIVSLSGVLISLLGAFATVGLLVGKAFSQGVGGFVNTDTSKFIQPIDTLVVQASINVILAQFVGIVAALWLLNRMSR